MVIFLPQEVIFEPGGKHAVVNKTLRRRTSAEVRAPLPEHVLRHFNSPAPARAPEYIRQGFIAGNSADIIDQRLGGELIDF